MLAALGRKGFRVRENGNGKQVYLGLHADLWWFVMMQCC